METNLNPASPEQGNLGNAIFSFPASRGQENTQKGIKMDAKCQSTASTLRYKEGAARRHMHLPTDQAFSAETECVLVRGLFVYLFRTKN